MFIGALDSCLDSYLVISQPFALMESERLEVLLLLLGCERSSCTVHGTVGYIELLIPCVEYSVFKGSFY